MSILQNQEERKRQLGDLICRRSTPITCEELLPPLLTFLLETFEELERLDRCFDLSHKETYELLNLDSLIRDIRLAVSLSARCLSQIRSASSD